MRLAKLIWLPAFVATLAMTQNAAALKDAGPKSTNEVRTGCVLSTAINGGTLTVKGTTRDAPHDLLFAVSGCSETVLLTFAGDQDNDLSARELRRNRALKRFQKYTSSTFKSKGNVCSGCKKYSEVEAELTGKLEIATLPPGGTKDRSGFVRNDSGKIIGKFGWGHPAPFAPYRLVIQSVKDPKAKRLPPPV